MASYACSKCGEKGLYIYIYIYIYIYTNNIIKNMSNKRQDNKRQDNNGHLCQLLGGLLPNNHQHLEKN